MSLTLKFHIEIYTEFTFCLTVLLFVSASPRLHRSGSRACKGPGSSMVLDALSCNLSLIFKHSGTKWDTKRHS